MLDRLFMLATALTGLGVVSAAAITSGVGAGMANTAIAAVASVDTAIAAIDSSTALGVPVATATPDPLSLGPPGASARIHLRLPSQQQTHRAFTVAITFDNVGPALPAPALWLYAPGMDLGPVDTTCGAAPEQSYYDGDSSVWTLTPLDPGQSCTLTLDAIPMQAGHLVVEAAAAATVNRVLDHKLLAKTGRAVTVHPAADCGDAACAPGGV